jgi:hypothetical protein
VGLEAETRVAEDSQVSKGLLWLERYASVVPLRRTAGSTPHSADEVVELMLFSIDHTYAVIQGADEQPHCWASLAELSQLLQRVRGWWVAGQKTGRKVAIAATLFTMCCFIDLGDVAFYV